MTNGDPDRHTPVDRRGRDRRSGAERRVAVLSFARERRRLAERRAGVERRLGALAPADLLRVALDLLFRVAEARALDDVTLRQLDGAIVRVRAAVEWLEGAPARRP